MLDTPQIELRDYQNRFVKFFLRHMLLPNPEREYLLSSPTGSGKTLVLQTLVGHLINTDAFSHCLIITPQIQIEQGFLFGQGKNDIEIRTYKGDLVLRADEWEAYRNQTRKLKTFLRVQPKKGQTRVIVTTHAAVTRKHRSTKDFLPDDLSGVLLVVDEAHRAGERNQLGQDFIQDWKSRGGTIIYATATPFRTDGAAVIPEDVCRQTRTLAEHADGIHAPSNLLVRAVPIALVANNQAQYSGSALGYGDRVKAIREITNLWEKDGRPKAIVIVPSRNSKQWADDLKRAFQDTGARVHNAVGVSPTDGDLSEMLRRERSVRNYADSEVDVILACKRFDEGTDWPLASHTYNVNIPGAFNLVLQRWGRTMRDKSHIKGYPPEHANVSCITFLVPHISDKTWDKFENHHKDHVFLLACFLQDYETANEYRACLRWRPEDVGRSRSGKNLASDNDLLEDIQAELMALGADNVRIEAIQIVVQLERDMIDLGMDRTVGNALGYATKTLKLPPEQVQAIKDLWGYRLLLSEDGQRAMHTMIQRLKNRSKGSPLPRSLIRTSLREAFDEVIAAHENDIIRSEIEGVSRYIGKLTGREAQVVAEDLRNRLSAPPFSDDDLMAAVLAFMEDQ